MLVLRPNFEKREVDGIKGLVTVVAQDALTKEVLMIAYTDEAGWRNTLKTGLGTYYSTSRKESWVKGATSNNLQKVVDILVDCDGDGLVYLVEPQGNKVACHTDARSCFYRSITRPRAYVPPKETEKEGLESVEAEVCAELTP